MQPLSNAFEVSGDLKVSGHRGQADGPAAVQSRRILLSYASEYDTGEGIHYARVLRRLGHRVHEVNIPAMRGATGRRTAAAGYPSDVTVDELIRDAGGADLFLYLEPMGIVPRGLESAPMPTACVLSDTHRNPRARRLVASLFDHVVVYHRNHLAAHRDRRPGTAHWIPYACDTDVVRDLRLPRDLDVAFVGRPYTRERRRILRRLAGRHAVNEPRTYRQDEISELYSRAKIVIDLPPGDYIPFRVFEAMSCGALLLTRRMPSGIEELFEEGRHYEAFATERELLDKIERYLRDDDARRRVAAAGHAEIRRHHTLAQRITRILDAVAHGPRHAAPVRSMSRAAREIAYARVYERTGRVETLLRQAVESGDWRRACLWRWYACRAFARRMLLRW